MIIWSCTIVLSFFVYSFLGWLWESTVCSLYNEKQLINRGFLVRGRYARFTVQGHCAVILHCITCRIRQLYSFCPLFCAVHWNILSRI